MPAKPATRAIQGTSRSRPLLPSGTETEKSGVAVLLPVCPSAGCPLHPAIIAAKPLVDGESVTGECQHPDGSQINAGTEAI